MSVEIVTLHEKWELVSMHNVDSFFKISWIQLDSIQKM